MARDGAKCRKPGQKRKVWGPGDKLQNENDICADVWGQDGLGHKCGVAVSQSFKFILNSSISTPENPSGPTAVAE